MLQIRHTSQASQLAKRTTDLVELQKSNKELKNIVDAKADELGRALACFSIWGEAVDRRLNKSHSVPQMNGTGMRDVR